MAKKKTKRAPTKKQQAQQERTTYFLIGLSFIVFGILGGLRLGFLGMLMTNVFRFFVGNMHLVMALYLIVYGALLMLMGKDPKFKRKSLVVGLFVFFLGLLLFLEIGLFKQISRDTNILGMTWQKISSDIKASSVTQSVGGGMIGALLYTVTYFLVSKAGSYVVAVLAMIAGGLLVSNIGISQVADKVVEFGTNFFSFA